MEWETSMHIYYQNMERKVWISFGDGKNRHETVLSNFQNRRRFSHRCLSKDILPVSVKLKSIVKTPKGKNLVRKAERALLNERVRLINNTMFMHQIDTCIDQFKKENWQGNGGKLLYIYQEQKGIKTLKDLRETEIKMWKIVP